MIHLEQIWGRVHLHMTVQRMGCDYTVALYGGDAHVGAVVLALPEGAGTEPRAANNAHDTTAMNDASARVLTVPGHREDALACSVAQHLASTLQARVCVACGIHLDYISADEITTVLRLTESLTREAVAALIEK